MNNTIKQVTNIFAIVGIFIPGFTALGLSEFQIIIQSTGLKCESAWNLLWLITGSSCLLLPIGIILLLKKNKHRLATYLSETKLTFTLLLFNLIEYSFLQLTLGLFFTTGKTLCYKTDGQNGIELIFSGWAAIPILYLLGLLFQRLSNNLISQK